MPAGPENLFLRAAQVYRTRLTPWTLAKKPTAVRLDPNMVEKFKRQVMIAQTMQPK